MSYNSNVFFVIQWMCESVCIKRSDVCLSGAEFRRFSVIISGVWTNIAPQGNLFERYKWSMTGQHFQRIIQKEGQALLILNLIPNYTILKRKLGAEWTYFTEKAFLIKLRRKWLYNFEITDKLQNQDCILYPEEK